MERSAIRGRAPDIPHRPGLRWRSVRATPSALCRPLSIHARKSIPLYRNSVSTYVSAILIRRKGAVVRRHEPRIGERWTRQRRAREAGAGRDEPRELQAACGRAALMRTAKSRGPGCRCYSQALRRCAEPDRAKRAANSRGDGDNRNSSPGRARHTPSNIAQGRPDDRLPCVSLVHCVCNVLARGSCGCQPAPGLPCALFFGEGVKRSAKLGRTRREEENLCLKFQR